MKLYLSSYGPGNEPDYFTNMIGANKRCAIIMNAQDLVAPSSRSERLGQEIARLGQLGLQAEELDLREYFDGSKDIAGDLQEYGSVWLRGGNVFVLRRAMQQSGFDTAIKPLVESEALVYGGFSAGTCAATPNFEGLELVDDKDSVPPGYAQPAIWEGLHFVDYAVAPHYRSDHPESADIEHVVTYFQQHDIVYKTLRDGQAIVVDGEIERMVG